SSQSFVLHSLELSCHPLRILAQAGNEEGRGSRGSRGSRGRSFDSATWRDFCNEQPQLRIKRSPV
ncbi:hypothetical protein, partial [Nostoc sp. UHCC 0251]|uniref:hypothetical protein n=1 Tax=Nostoc sp. UHCC 0251 TaxID=3110240 RepID=UPI002B21F54A